MGKCSDNAIVYKSDGVRFRILKVTKATKHGPRQYFLLDDRSTGKRRLLSNTTLGAAKNRADAIRKAMAKGQAGSLAMSDSDWWEWKLASNLLKAENPQATIYGAIQEYVEARRILGPGLRLVDAASGFQKQREANEPDWTATPLQEAAARYLHSKQLTGKSASHCKNIECRFKRLAATLPKDAQTHELTAGQLEIAVASLKLGAKTSNDYRLMLVNFFTWCGKQNPPLVPPNQNPAKSMDRHTEVHGEVRFVSSAQLRQILVAAQNRRPDLLPYLALVAFAGLRPAEVKRLDWSEINGAYIRLPGTKSKTGRSRQIPIQPNLAAWLELWRKPQGLVCPHIDLFHVNSQIRRISGITLPHDGLRHGYGTHRCAILRNVAAVALEMGNDARVCERHYLNAFCAPEEANEWFSLKPANEHAETSTTAPDTSTTEPGSKRDSAIPLRGTRSSPTQPACSRAETTRQAS